MGEQKKQENLCWYDGIFSRCSTAGWAAQKRCRFAVKSTGRDECLYFWDDRHCWEIEAGHEAREDAVEP